MRELTHLSLFTGIGGLDLAAEAAGFRTVGQCEWADYPTAVLERHWPNVPRWRDIHSLTGEDFYHKTGLRTVDLLTGGFPCQPFSQAGKRRGKEDDRYLWPEMLRIIRELKPTWVLGENVPGIVNLALDTVLSDLEAEGYEVQTFIIPACGVDAPHKRDRCAILAHAIDRSLPLRRDRQLQNAPEDGGKRLDYGGRAPELFSGQRRQNKPGAPGVAYGLRAEIYRADPNADADGLQTRNPEPVLAPEVFTICPSRERERERAGRGYDGLLRSFLELTPRGRIGLMNPDWTEWLMGYPIGWTALNASETP